MVGSPGPPTKASPWTHQGASPLDPDQALRPGPARARAGGVGGRAPFALCRRRRARALRMPFGDDGRHGLAAVR